MVTQELAKVEIVVRELALQAIGLVEEANDCRIIVPVHYEQAGEWVQVINGKMKGFEEERKSITKPLDESKARVINLFRPILTSCEEAIKIVKAKMLTYQQEQEVIRRQEEDRLREETRKENERLQKDAERKAAKEEAKGNSDRAEEIREAVQPAPMPIVVQTETPKVKGISMREHWKFRITNPDLVPREYCIPDESAIRGIVNTMKGKTSIAGVEPYREDIVASGRK